TLNNLGADATASFTGTLLKYKINGRATKDGTGLSDVQVTLSGSESGSIKTDSSGNYSFTVTAEGNYTVTATKPNFAFSPATTVLSNLSADATANFSASLVKYKISGRVTDGTVALSDVL